MNGCARAPQPLATVGLRGGASRQCGNEDVFAREDPWTLRQWMERWQLTTDCSSANGPCVHAQQLRSLMRR